MRTILEFQLYFWNFNFCTSALTFARFLSILLRPSGQLPFEPLVIFVLLPLLLSNFSCRQWVSAFINTPIRFAVIVLVPIQGQESNDQNLHKNLDGKLIYLLTNIWLAVRVLVASLASLPCLGRGVAGLQPRLAPVCSCAALLPSQATMTTSTVTIVMTGPAVMDNVSLWFCSIRVWNQFNWYWNLKVIYHMKTYLQTLVFHSQ